MHSFNSCLIHAVWTTKGREPVLHLDLRERLFPYLAGIARKNRVKALAVSGVVDHVHTLLSLPATLCVADAIQLLKGNSSKWINEAFPKRDRFGWQEGHGAFSIGISGIDATKRYIRNQVKHHRQSFLEEFRTMLRRHGLKYDERMLDQMHLFVRTAAEASSY